jgi:hypothetical protein
MKAILEFDLPEEQDEFDLATNGRDYLFALMDIQKEIRAIHKYQELDEKEFKVVEEIYQMVCTKIANVKTPM